MHARTSLWRPHAGRPSSCVVVALALLLASCSASVPSENDAKEEFTSKHRELIDKGLVVIDAFSKVNAQGGAKDGWYKVEYRATISYPKGINTRCLEKKKKKYDWADTSPINLTCVSVWTEEVGAVEEVSGSLEFEMTEKGWRGTESRTIY